MQKIKAPTLSVLEASRAKRVKYTPKRNLEDNLILKADSYKAGHGVNYAENIVGMFSYTEARTKGKDIIVPFGRQGEVQKLLRDPITTEMIDEAEAHLLALVGPGAFNREPWDYIVEKYNGFMPFLIRGVPEGTPVPSGNILSSVMCIDEYVSRSLFWLAGYFETALLRAEWYGTTIASNGHKAKRILREAFVLTGAPLEALPYYLHSFAGRGVSSAESAEIGDGAHALNFMGSDTLEGQRYAAHYYNKGVIPSASVIATEHSIQCSYQAKYGEVRDAIQILNGDEDYLENMIRRNGRQGNIVSMVIDGYDVYKATRILCSPRFKALVAEIGCKIVLRPDSGDMMAIVPWILDQLAEAYGVDITVGTDGREYKLPRGVGVLQGDGISLVTMEQLLNKIVGLGYRADAVVYGSGGALLQKVDRDTYKFAQKAAAVLYRDPESGNCEWVGIVKDPITDPGKKSKIGVLSLFRSKMTGQYATFRIDQGPIDSEWEDVMVDIYENGEFFNETTLDEAKARTGL